MASAHTMSLNVISLSSSDEEDEDELQVLSEKIVPAKASLELTPVEERRLLDQLNLPNIGSVKIRVKGLSGSGGVDKRSLLSGVTRANVKVVTGGRIIEEKSLEINKIFEPTKKPNQNDMFSEVMTISSSDEAESDPDPLPSLIKKSLIRRKKSYHVTDHLLSQQQIEVAADSVDIEEEAVVAHMIFEPTISPSLNADLFSEIMTVSSDGAESDPELIPSLNEEVNLANSKKSIQVTEDHLLSQPQIEVANDYFDNVEEEIVNVDALNGETTEDASLLESLFSLSDKSACIDNDSPSLDNLVDLDETSVNETGDSDPSQSKDSLSLTGQLNQVEVDYMPVTSQGPSEEAVYLNGTLEEQFVLVDQTEVLASSDPESSILAKAETVVCEDISSQNDPDTRVETSPSPLQNTGDFLITSIEIVDYHHASGLKNLSSIGTQTEADVKGSFVTEVDDNQFVDDVRLVSGGCTNLVEETELKSTSCISLSFTSNKSGELFLPTTQLSLLLPPGTVVDVVSLCTDSSSLAADTIWDGWAVSHVSVQAAIRGLDMYGDVSGRREDLLIKQQLHGLEKTAAVEKEVELMSKKEFFAKVGLCSVEERDNIAVEINYKREIARRATRLRSGSRKRPQLEPVRENSTEKGVKRKGKRRKGNK